MVYQKSFWFLSKGGKVRKVIFQHTQLRELKTARTSFTGKKIAIEKIGFWKYNKILVNFVKFFGQFVRLGDY